MAQRVAIYCRGTTTDKSCRKQERDLQAHARKHGWKVAGVWKESGSRSANSTKERQEVIELAQDKDIDLVLVSELARWGRSILDLNESLHELNGVSIIALSGLQIDLRNQKGKLVANVMTELAEFENEVNKEQVKFGIAEAKARGQKIGRQLGQRVKADKVAPKVIKMVNTGMSYRRVADLVKISKTTVTEIMKRHRGKIR